MIALFWDIDGTLLSTGKAGVISWEAAVKTVTGRDFALSSIRVPGLTDYQVAVKTFEMLAMGWDEPTLHGMVRMYEEGLPLALPLRQGHVMPNVREILDHLTSRVDIRSYLLTGNTRDGALAKLRHYELVSYFAGGAYAENAEPRTAIARRALDLARQDGLPRNGPAFVIGDTPHDIACGLDIGAKVIAVATGGYTLDELVPRGPWLTLRELPPPDEFLRLIDEAVGCG
jgi:phosphoglycolate phosphatase